jgi:hypothetical protein
MSLYDPLKDIPSCQDLKVIDLFFPEDAVSDICS